MSTRRTLQAIPLPDPSVPYQPLPPRGCYCAGSWADLPARLRRYVAVYGQPPAGVRARTFDGLVLPPGLNLICDARVPAHVAWIASHEEDV